jgi:hypothetical protein
MNRYLRTVVGMALYLSLYLLFLVAPNITVASVGITPEQIFQPTIDINHLIGTWEELPDTSPLQDTGSIHTSVARTLITLRKDGTCRYFSKSMPMGSDGLWVLEDHEIQIKLKNSSEIIYYVYGIKDDFMITKSKISNDKDVLWAKVK